MPSNQCSEILTGTGRPVQLKEGLNRLLSRVKLWLSWLCVQAELLLYLAAGQIYFQAGLYYSSVSSYSSSVDFHHQFKPGRALIAPCPG
jgi:hypothetical protein